jgi:hypothetical protein
VELGHGLRDSNDTEKRSGGDIHIADFLASFSLELPLFNVLGNDVVVEFSRDGRFKCLSVSNERPHYFRINFYCFFGSFELLMHLRDVPSQLLIEVRICLIKQEEDQIKTGKKSSCKVDIFVRSEIFIVSAVHGVCCSKN